jgi:geranylgeranyl reductase family protein
MKQFDAVVVGTGPSGGMAAYELAKGGLKVAIIDKETLPRYKTCGGGLVIRGREMIPFNIQEAIEREYYQIHVYFNHLKEPLVAHRDFPIVSMVMRDKLDFLIVQEAVKEGAVLLDNHTLEDIQFQDQITLITNQGLIQTQYVIAADGVLGKTAKLTGWPETRNLIPALEYEVEVNEEDFKRLSEEARFDIDAIPDGYAWCFPKANHLSIGVGLFKKGKVNLKNYYLEYLKKLQIEHIVSESAHGFQIPIGQRRDGFVKNNVFLVGDAAGLADPLTAEGISNGIHSGILAGKAIANNFKDPESAKNVYLATLKEHILGDLNFLETIASFFYSFTTIRNYLITQNGQRFLEVLTDLFAGKMKLTKDIKDKVLKKFGLSK